MAFALVLRNALSFLVAVAFALIQGLALMGLEGAPQFGTLRLEVGQGLGCDDAVHSRWRAGSTVFACRKSKAASHHSCDGETG